GGIEAGGSKFVCGVGNRQGQVIDETVIPTTDPVSTIDQVVVYFQQFQSIHTLQAIGLASFGPIDLNPKSEHYGFITSTPKTRWQYFDIKGTLERALGFTIPCDTDVNAAVLAEHRWGAAMGVDNVVYMTVGTGIGGGVMVNGQLLHGLLHPELGHMRLRCNGDVSEFAGVCPFHDHCLEGLASGPAIKARWGREAHELPDDHPAWEIEARYLAEGVANVVLVLSPELVILGGGVMKRRFLFPMIHKNVLQLLNNYIQKPEILVKIDEYITPAKLNGHAGLLGAIALAIQSGED
ncbi:MAG: ROK family protein, partial [Anaerolineales bacterium]|nr:ROK family protein [Anaerolineales bacterium]